MATVYSGEVSVGTYNRIRLKLDYSGTSATATIQFRRTSAYNTKWSSTTSTLTVNGTSKAYNYSYSGNVGTGWVDLLSVSGYTVSTVGGTYNWSLTQGNGALYGSGTIAVPAQAGASGLSTSLESVTWNTVRAKASVSSWNGTGAGLQFVVNSTRAHGENARQAYEVTKTATSGTMTATNSNYVWRYDTSFPIKGCMDFYLTGYAVNTQGAVADYYGNTTLYHTPPAPLQTLSKTETTSNTSTSVTHNLTIVGGTSSNNYTKTVTTQYRYSTDGGSTWSSWTSAGTGNPWDTKTASFTSSYGASIKVEARQVYSNLNSEVKSLSYTATSSTAPSGGTVSVSSTTYNSFTLKGSISSYGTPNSVDGRRINIGAGPEGPGKPRLEVSTKNATSATVTVTNSSTPYDGGFTIKGCQYLIPYIYAHNQLYGALWSGAAFYTKPASPKVEVTGVSRVGNNAIVTVKVSGTSDNESVTADAFRVCIYKHGEAYQTAAVGAVIGWTDMGSANASSGSLTKELSLPIGSDYDIYADMLYQNQYASNAKGYVDLTNIGGGALLYGQGKSTTTSVTNIAGTGRFWNGTEWLGFHDYNLFLTKVAEAGLDINDMVSVKLEEHKGKS